MQLSNTSCSATMLPNHTHKQRMCLAPAARAATPSLEAHPQGNLPRVPPQDALRGFALSPAQNNQQKKIENPSPTMSERGGR
jgi:hypothetical protein